MSYIQEMFGLEDKTVILTGGGGAIAGALAEAYLKAGANVALWDIKLEFAETAAERLSAAAGDSGKILPVEVDAMSEDSVGSALEKTFSQFGSIDVLVNAAGGNRGKGPFVETDVALFESIVRLNLVAGLLVPTKVTAAWWIANKKKGSIINLASMSSYIPLSGVWAYDAAKAGVL
ncbi:MAG: SDR family NAD(P)-dependent oxidoreductase, partial [Spirochaetes bacterium]|nr:SDR family NAD(P)-dependent oxidoreductase [Spirochaetota bacterium]